MWWRERQIKKSRVIGRDVPTPPSRRTCQLQLEMAQVIHPINFCNSMRTPKQAIYHLPCSCRSFPPLFTNWISLFLFKFHWLSTYTTPAFSLLHISFVAAKSCYIICGCAFVLLVISFFFSEAHTFFGLYLPQDKFELIWDKYACLICKTYAMKITRFEFKMVCQWRSKNSEIGIP